MQFPNPRFSISESAFLVSDSVFLVSESALLVSESARDLCYVSIETSVLLPAWEGFICARGARGSYVHMVGLIYARGLVFIGARPLRLG